MNDLKHCPKCGYQEPPIWRHTFRRLYTEHCYIDDLDPWDADLAAELRKKKFVVKDGVRYALNKKGYVHRIDIFLCANPDPHSHSMNEPVKEKHKARILGKQRNQKLLMFSEEGPAN